MSACDCNQYPHTPECFIYVLRPEWKPDPIHEDVEQASHTTSE